MIRTACTWVLLVLAASPFTAPYATCDLGALLSRSTPAHLSAPCYVRPKLESEAQNGDANSISPLVTRVVVARGAALAVSVCPVPEQDDRPAATVVLIEPQDRPPDEPVVQLIVLRV